MRLVLPVPPTANRWWRKGKNHLYTPVSVREYKLRVEVEVRNARVRKFPRETELVVSLWWFRKAKQGDLDKRVGVLLDALQGCWYENDCQVVELHCYRLDDKLNPRIEVEVRPFIAEAAA